VQFRGPILHMHAFLNIFWRFKKVCYDVLLTKNTVLNL
jgi:hypothetical protein